MGAWAVLCGALASTQLRWQGSDLLILALAILLVEFGWGSLWDLAVMPRWFQPIRQNQPHTNPTLLTPPPFTQPGSPASRLNAGLNRFLTWWRGVLWPAFAPALLGMVAAISLSVVLLLLLPERLAFVATSFVALAWLGAIWASQGRVPLGAQALALVGLGWLAGHAAFADVTRASLAMSALFAATTWGLLRMSRGRAGGIWLLNASQVALFVFLIVLKQPLSAGATGLLLFAQVALQIALRPTLPPTTEGTRARLYARACPLLAVSMLIAALAVP